ncbi:MAG: CRISPR-associated endonuclease Cas2 [Candidatus Harrisonbacteria bacterium]|nr:CRISPR-associated endonuclease Cas2 [Candidatus Harrisonbacteria bacterium]
MKGQRTFEVLEAITRFVGGAGDFAAAFLRAGYGSSHRRINRELERLHDEKVIAAAARLEAQRLHSLLYKLRKDGLIAAQGSIARKAPQLTARGKLMLTKLRARNAIKLPAPTYVCVPSTKFTIITFDIPERERRKRDWLRDVLKNLKFAMLQKSVWIGKVKVPEEFLDDLKKHKLLGLVEIFEISKGGTLRQLA